MSQQATPDGGSSLSHASSRPKPRKYPSFSFRRAASRSNIKETDEILPGERTHPTMSESVDEHGKLIHVRVTLGYLKSIQKVVKTGKSQNKSRMESSLVTAFASLEPQISSDHNFAPSMPLSLTSNVNTVVWPKQKHSSEGDDAVDKSNRRLYFSTTLQKDSDDNAELRHVLTHEDDLSEVTGTSAWNNQETITYAPKVIKIQLGVARGKDLLHLGVATLVLDGTDVSGKQMDLYVRTLLPGEDDSSSAGANSSPNKRRGLKRLFGKKSKSAQNAFAADEYEYMFTPNALLRIRIDVTSDATPFARASPSGPAVWGDGIEDDNDSFASIVVMDLTREKTPPPEEEAATKEGSQLEGSLVQINKDTSESIEVVNNPTGPSIISMPPKYAEPDVLDLPSPPSYPSVAPVSSVVVSPLEEPFISPTSHCSDSPSPSILASTGMMCGFTDAFSPAAVEAHPTQNFNFEDSSTIATSLYKGTNGEAWKRAARKKSTNSIAANSGVGNRSFGTLDERTEDDTSRASGSRASYSNTSYTSYSRASYSRASQSRASASRASAARSTVSGNSLSIGEDTMKSLDEAKKALQVYAERTGENYHDMLENLDTASMSDILSLDHSVGEDTIDSVLEAKELLQSYASRVGIDVEDLLHVDLNNFSKFLSPSSILGTSRSEGTNDTSKSSKSRFSLFVDDDE